MKIYIDVSKIKIFQMELLENFMAKNDIEYSRIYTIESIDERDKEIERLNNIIDKAIEYIEDNSTNTYLLKSFDIDMLLEILKGEDKE